MNCRPRYSVGRSSVLFFASSTYLFRPTFELIKIYIGQLPLETEEQYLRSILEPMASLREVKIIKGDHNRGKFDLFCYAFVTMQGNQAFAHDIINKLQKDHPSWKMNVKHDDNRRKMQKSYPNPNMGFPQPHSMPYPGYPPVHPFPAYHPPPVQPSHSTQSSPQHQMPSTSSDKITGEKPCNIMVRQLWLGGIPEQMDKGFMIQLMGYYGIIEQIQMFPKFAFVKYKQVHEATLAFERAQEVYQKLGFPQGFRVFFSDPARRSYVVSNHYQFERQAPHVPILFIGFPPVTSSTVEMQVIKPVVQNIHPVTSEYLRKNTNAQNRSYFLFSFESVQNALKVKDVLHRRKDLLGDKRAEVAVLIDEKVIMKNRDISHTQRLFQGDNANQDKMRRNMPNMWMDPNMKGMMPPPMGYPMYPNLPNPYMPPYYPNPYMFEQQQGYFKPPEQGNEPQRNIKHGNGNGSNENQRQNIHDLLKDVMKGTESEKKPEKSEGREQDILSKLLGSEANIANSDKQQGQYEYKKEDREPSWSGFLTFQTKKKVGVDGHSKKFQSEDYSINIHGLIEFKDMYLNEKNVMILEASNNIDKQNFKEYTKGLKSRAGVAVNKDFLMYIMSKCEQSEAIEEIGDDQLLVVLQKVSTMPLVKDKLLKGQELDVK